MRGRRFNINAFEFTPSGTPLGNEGSPSMPGAPSLGFGNPRAEAAANFQSFVQQHQRSYGYSSLRNTKGLYDPRGGQAMVPYRPADFRQGAEVQGTGIQADLEGQADHLLNGGRPMVAPYTPRSQVNFGALYQGSNGLKPERAAMLARALGQQKASISSTMRVPNNNPLPQVTNELGLTTPHGGLPNTALEQNLTSTGPATLAAVATRMMIQKQRRRVQGVDENGCVTNKYAPGTGPYDAPGLTRPGGIGNAKPGTRISGHMGALGGMSVIAGTEKGEDDVIERSVSLTKKVGYGLLGALGVIGAVLVVKGVQG